MTPETQGGYLKGQVEIQQTTANLVKVKTAYGTVTDGVSYNNSSRTGYLLSASLLEMLDFYWSHTGSANSLLGAKVQLYGAARGGTGHKVAAAAAFGGNDHEMDSGTKFNLSAQELSLIYGYRIAPYAMPYANFSHARFSYESKIKAPGSAVNGKEPSYETTVNSLNTGVEFGLGSIVSKLECSYQKLNSDRTKDRTRLVFGYSIGFAW